MTSLIVFVICFLSCTIGAICGIGGGVIIKPALDSIQIMDVGTISFLSGCTVLAMTVYSFVRSKKSGQSKISIGLSIPLAIGAAVGGVLGKELFSYIKQTSHNIDKVGAIQAICLLLVTAGALIYNINRSRIRTHNVENPFFCVMIGFALGAISAFLGIGGGPINLVVLFFFFSMEIKTAAENSLFIILFSQTASLLMSILTHTVPDYRPELLLVMILGGITGGILGRGLNRKLRDHTIDQLFITLMLIMIAINIRNIYLFLK